MGKFYWNYMKVHFFCCFCWRGVGGDMELLNVKRKAFTICRWRLFWIIKPNASPLILSDCHIFATICHDNHPRSWKPPMWFFAGFWVTWPITKITHITCGLNPFLISNSNSNSNILERCGTVFQKCAWKKYCFWSKVSQDSFEVWLFHGNQWFNSPLIRPYLL